MNNIAGAILAGGLSTRMGTDKSQLQLNNKSLLNHSKKILYNAGLKSIFISDKNGIKDQFKNKGPLSGIFSCLNELERYDYILFVPVDMPLLNTKLIQTIIKEKRNELCFLKGNHFPLLIKNNQHVRQQINDQIANNNLAIYQLLNKLKIHVIQHTIEQKYFFNANFPKQWLEVKQLLHSRQQ